MSDTEYLIVGYKPDATRPQAWNIFPTREMAEACMVNRKADLDEDYVKYEVMTWEEYEAQQRAAILSDPLVEISKEKWWEMLEILPPKKWEGLGTDFEVFQMIEHLTGPYTSQYARLRDRYFTRLVHTSDRSTWITREECLRCTKPPET